MTGIARETLVLRRGGISPPLALLIPTFAFPDAPESLAELLQRRLECSPTDAYRIPRLRQYASYPIIIHAQLLDQ